LLNLTIPPSLLARADELIGMRRRDFTVGMLLAAANQSVRAQERA
jgi:hypothetical protein